MWGSPNNKIHINRILERRPTHRPCKCSSIANFTSIGSSKVDTSTIDLRTSTHRRVKAETSHRRHRISSTCTCTDNSNTRVTPHCTCYVLNAYLYCVYALVGRAISIRDPYICAVSWVCANKSHTVFHGPVVCAVKT